MITLKQANEASRRVEEDLSDALGPKLEGILGIAVAWSDCGELYVRVDVERDAEPNVAARLPATVAGVNVRLSSERSGRTTKFDRVARKPAAG